MRQTMPVCMMRWLLDDKIAALRLCPLFAGWNAAQLASLATLARAEHYQRGAAIFSRDPERREAFVVATGGVEISRASASGRKFVLSFSGPHDVVGLVRLLPQPPIHYDYRACMDSVLLHLPLEELMAMLDAEPALWRDVALLMCARQGESLRQINDRQLGSLEQRMAAVLLDLAQAHGVGNEQGVDLGLRLSQEQLAAMLGVARQSANRLLRRFEQQGLIAIEYSRITIRDHAGLASRAGDQG